MELWTEYEGRTIDGDFPLTKLLQPEGRSAFFSTSNGTGVPTVIRLIESHFDDDEILARWRSVTELNQPNLVKLKKYGQVELDGTSLVYAVMEPVEANLGEIVSQGRLSAVETRQIATSLAAALEALHTRGLVHEHVEPANVMAVGDVVKLRSDCVREAAEGREGDQQKARDVHDFAVVLLQVLTQQKTLQGASRDLPLAAPFDEIVRKGMSGEWGLKEIGRTLEATAPRQEVVQKKMEAAAVAPAVAAESRKVASPVVPVSTPAAAPSAAPSAAPAAAPRTAPVAASAGTEKKVYEMPRTAGRIPAALDDDLGPGRGVAVKLLMAVAVLLVIWIGWRVLRGRSESASAPQTSSRSAPIANGSAGGTPEIVNAPVVEGPAAPAAPTKRSAGVPMRGAAVQGEQWRVVAFTYNHQDQAQHKAETVAQEHPDLKPEVFTPNGRAPYLVTLGGGMSREDAFGLSGKAKREGMPKDIYAQNYRSQMR